MLKNSSLDCSDLLQQILVYLFWLVLLLIHHSNSILSELNSTYITETLTHRVYEQTPNNF